jgi:uncharacterized protein YcfJ
MGRTLISLIATALMAVLPVAAFAQMTPGTTLIGTFNNNLSSNHAQPGTPFTISNAHTSNYDINGATIYGHVASVQPASQGRAGKITLAFDKVNTRAGNIYQISGYASNVNVQTKSNAGKELGGAAAGALVGGLLGHGIGAIIGAGAGGVYAKNSRQNVNIAQGTQISVQVTQSRRQSQ